MPDQLTITPALKARFWSKVRRGAPNECWLWIASRMKRMGYGKFGRGGKCGGWTVAHRVAYELTCGSIPDNLHVLHRCDNPPCVNPAHLFLGTAADNIKDKVSKKRHRWKTHYGEAAGSHKITAIQVREIRRRFASGESRASLAREFGLSWTTTDFIVKRRAWKHVA